MPRIRLALVICATPCLARAGERPFRHRAHRDLSLLIVRSWSPGDRLILS